MGTDTIWTPFAERLRASEPFRKLLRGEARHAERLPPAAAAWVVELLARQHGRPGLVVVPHETEALAWMEGAELFGRGAAHLPALSLTPYHVSSVSLGERVDTTRSLQALRDGPPPVTVVTPRALARRLPPPASWEARRLDLAPGAQVSLDTLVARLVDGGYERADLVVEPGRFAVRGGVVDIYPAGEPAPVRLDLLGDEVDSLRRFDAESQRSGNRLERVSVLPLEPFPAGPEAARTLARRLEAALPSRPGQAALEALDELATGAGFDGWTRLSPAVAAETTGIEEWLPEPLVVVLQPQDVVEELRRHAATLAREHRTLATERPLPRPGELERSPDHLVPWLERAELVVGDLTSDESADFGAVTTDVFHRQLPRFPGEVRQAQERGETVAVVTGQAEREGVERYLDQLERSESATGVELVEGELSRGFRLPPAGLTLYSERQLFARPVARRAAPSRRRPFTGGLGELKIGDYVVHRDHGIGQLRELRTVRPGSDGSTPLPPGFETERPVEVGEFEALVIDYADGRTLLLPLARIDAIHRYSGAEGAAPRLDRLGGASWNARKERVRRGMRKLAGDLVRLYAERQLARAPAIPAPGALQAEFAERFEHQETPDQAQAIEAIAADLQQTVPMDRLLCGDVGFGKTEVAMRAALQVVEGGYQVAVLAPTTILADQHLETFRARFEGFPVHVEMVSRFRSDAEVRETLGRTAAGEVDILIGTHRLLSRDVEIPRLGLLVVDEEQRFGVAQKERFKQLRKNVHVLSLSATPVPRTLQMALAGVRDLSVIETPPSDRLAVETAIVPLDEELVREAVEHELDRGGQVYYVHNRVESIEEIARWLRELVPQARLTIGHGQLPERELAARMHAFKAGEADLLLATSIIENGIDIPSVNTMLIHRADRFGLAQLYQLRGRVGRSHELAYCYLLVPRDMAVQGDARRRLEAIREFTELGSGFRVAARDLEIRGAGNLLGAEQSGHIAAVGIETYLRMLEETVRELRGEAVEEAPSAVFELPVDAGIPTDYVASQNLRMELYREIADAATTEAVLEALGDRFGPPPPPVRRLVELAALKRLAEAMRVQSVVGRGRRLDITLRRDARVDPDRLIRLVGEAEGASFSPSGQLTLTGVEPERMLATVRETLDEIATAGETVAAG